jgi:predicted 3-demethylubiquinone-9 3-methyltransferase (glyoxalase superfamily)
MTQAETTTTTAGKKESQVQGPTPCLVFSDRAEEAVNFYVSLFRNSRILSLVRSDGNGPVPKGKLLSATFQLDGRDFTAFDGGPQFSFTDGFSFMVICETQAEIDDFWARLSSGGEEGPCGWLKDRFGVSWQVIPSVLGQMLGDSTSGNSQKATEAMLKMRKLDIAALKRAYQSSS